MNLSAHFSLKEMLESQAARRKNILEQFEPPNEVIDRLKLLCEHILEPLRASINQPITISSGYRCFKTNKAIGGASNSQHILGEAADVEGTALSNKQLFDKILELGLPFDQLIWEFGTDANPAWVHVSFGPRNRKQVLHIK